MATADFYIRPEDGWVEVANAPATLLIKPSQFHPWWVANSTSEPSTTATAADIVMTFTGLPTAAQTVTIDGIVYTAVASDPEDFEFEIGTDAEETIDNLVLATAGHPTVKTEKDSTDKFVITARAAGTLGNSITVAETLSNASFAGAGTSLSGGADPLVGLAFGRDPSNQREHFEVSAGGSGKYYIRVQSALTASPADRPMHFGVITTVSP